MLLGAAALSCAAQPSTLVVMVDVSQEVHPISPDIYGISVSGGARPYFEDMGVTIVRWGGNARSRFNWEINASNAGGDWEFRNVEKGDEVPGSAAIEFHRNNLGVGAKSLITVPMIGWVARDRDNDTRSIDVPDGVINGYDPAENRLRTSFVSLARKGGAFEYPPDLEDEAVYQDEWLHHLSQRLGNAESGGIRFYEMDNEPMLWSETHRDIRPAPLGYDDYLDTFIEYAGAIKDVDPTAQALGPSSWGWTDYFYSALDRGDDNFGTAPDRRAHGGKPFIPWLLGELKEHDAATGRRTLDVLSIHYYPQGRVSSGDASEETQALRLRSTRSLWDSSYRDESWIARTEDGPVVRLIPRMREWIDANYPGTKLAITEWNWGAQDDISGSLAVADVLGVFGREGVDIATHWDEIGEGTPAYWAFRMFRNYDGDGGSFGDVSIKAESSQPNFVAAYASKSAETGAMTVILINKSPVEAAGIRLDVAGAVRGGEVAVYQYGPDTPDGIVHLASVSMDGGALPYTLPPYSITLLAMEGQG